MRVHTSKVRAHGVDASSHAFADCYGGYDNDELGEPVVLGKFEDGAQVDVGFTGTGLHFDVIVGCTVFYLEFRVVLEVVAFLHLDEVIKQGFTVEVKTVVDDAGGASCEERVLFGGNSIGCDAVTGAGHLGLPFEECHGRFNGTHLVLLGGVKDEALAARSYRTGGVGALGRVTLEWLRCGRLRYRYLGAGMRHSRNLSEVVMSVVAELALCGRFFAESS